MLIYRRFCFLSTSFEIALQELAGDLGVGDQIIWVDEMDYTQIPILYSLADLMINIPEADGLPVTLFEASARMTPVITSDLSAYQEFLLGGAYYCVDTAEIKSVVAMMQ